MDLAFGALVTPSEVDQPNDPMFKRWGSWRFIGPSVYAGVARKLKL